MSTVIYLIDSLGLRIGHEQGLESVGCCSLQARHAVLNPPNTLNLDFLGKDSVRYKNSVQVPTLVFDNIKQFLKGKKPQDHLFDLLAVCICFFFLFFILTTYEIVSASGGSFKIIDAWSYSKSI